MIIDIVSINVKLGKKGFFCLNSFIAFFECALFYEVLENELIACAKASKHLIMIPIGSKTVTW